MKLKKFVKENGIRIASNTATKALPNPVTLKNKQGEQVTVDFPAAIDTPRFSVYDVVCYLHKKCQNTANWGVHGSFKSWCHYFGYDIESTGSLKKYRAHKTMFRDTKNFMGETFEEFLSCRQ